MKNTPFKSAVVPKRISGSGETGANGFPSRLALLVKCLDVVELLVKSVILLISQFWQAICVYI